MSFSLMGTFLSHSTPVSCFHFIQPRFTRLFMSLCVPTFESNSDHKYLLLYSVYHPLVVFLHSFWICCHIIIVLARHGTYTLFLAGWRLKLEVSHRTRSTANSMAQGASLSISQASTSMMMMRSRGLIADP